MSDIHAHSTSFSDVSSITLTMTALLSEFLLALLVFISIFLLYYDEKQYPNGYGRPRTAINLAVIAMLLFVLKFGALLLTKDVLNPTNTLLAKLNISGHSRENAFSIMFFSSLIGYSIMIRITGGSRNSAFTPILFLVPTLAVFLQEPPVMLLAYTVTATVLFVTNLSPKHFKDLEWYENEKYVYILVSIGCLFISILTGYLTY